jgi:hypothetical protein
MDDGVSYMANRSDLRSAFEVACRHLNPGGVLVAGPDDTTETFIQNRTVTTPARGRGKPDNVEVVFIENGYDPDPSDDRYEATMVYLIREDGKLRIETDHHVLGLFPLDVWQKTLAGLGLEVHREGYVEDGREYVTFACLRQK